jgi:hypothetical protein
MQKCGFTGEMPKTGRNKKVCSALRGADTSKQNEKPTLSYTGGAGYVSV